jgi:hypothetical protein
MHAQRIHDPPEFFHCFFDHHWFNGEGFSLGFKTIENEEVAPPVALESSLV